MSTLQYEDLSVGQAISERSKGPMTSLHLMRWSSAIENWHRIHYDPSFATLHEGLPDLVINGSWKQHFLHQTLKDWVGVSGWVYRMRYQYRSLDVRGDTLTAGGTITDLTTRHNLGWVTLNIWIINGQGVTSTTGDATVVLPLNGGPPVPYPIPRHLTKSGDQSGGQLTWPP